MNNQMVAIRKDKIELLKQRYKITMKDLIRKNVHNKKDIENKNIQINRLINEKKGTIRNFGKLELAETLSHWFNKIKKADEPRFTPTYFLQKPVEIPVIATALEGNMTAYPKSKIWMLKDVDEQFSDCHAFIDVGQNLTDFVRIFKKGLKPSTTLHYNMCVVQEKGTKKMYWGYVIPSQAGRFSITDMNVVTGKRDTFIAKDIDLEWGSKIYQIRLYNKS